MVEQSLIHSSQSTHCWGTSQSPGEVPGSSRAIQNSHYQLQSARWEGEVAVPEATPHKTLWPRCCKHWLAALVGCCHVPLFSLPWTSSLLVSWCTGWNVPSFLELNLGKLCSGTGSHLEGTGQRMGITSWTGIFDMSRLRSAWISWQWYNQGTKQTTSPALVTGLSGCFIVSVSYTPRVSHRQRLQDSTVFPSGQQVWSHQHSSVSNLKLSSGQGQETTFLAKRRWLKAAVVPCTISCFRGQLKCF